MSLCEEGGQAPGRILLIFGRYFCQRRHLCDFPEGTWNLTLAAEDTGLTGERKLALTCERGQWRIGERSFKENQPFYFYTEKNEKFLLVLSEGIERLKPAERFYPEKEEKILIGSAFRNQIFYDCFSLVEPVHAEMTYRQQEWTVSAPKTSGIYVNGKALKDRKVLQQGDRVELYGLQILVLKGMLVCVSLCGVGRVVKGGAREDAYIAARRIAMDGIQDFPVYNTGRENAQGAETEERGENTGGKQWFERGHMQEETLRSGEVEIMLPREQKLQRGQPFILTMGPTLTMVLPMLLMAELGSRYMGNAGGGFYYLSAAMSGCSALLTLFWGLAGEAFRRRSNRQEQREREQQYREYLKGTEQELLNWQEENRRILIQRYPSLYDFLGEKGRDSVLWNRYYRQSDFLFLRLGLGEIPFQAELRVDQSQKNIVQRKAAVQAQELAERFRYLKEVPVGVDLYRNRQIGIVTGESQEEACELLLSLFMQIMICHCYTEVRIVCFYRKERTTDQRLAACLRWMPHCWSSDRKTRFLAGDEREAGEILPVLTREIAGSGPDRGEEKGMRIPWYIVLVLEEELIAGEPFYRCLTRTKEDWPLSSIFVGKEREVLPKSCRYFLRREGTKIESLSLGEERIESGAYVSECCGFIQAQQFVRRLTGCRVRDTESDKEIPDKVDFLQLYGCSRVEELDSGKRWRLSATGERLKVPVGAGVGGRIVSLDVHERFHGPHGLVAGTTGSGKSELLQTYLLSMAVSFSPEEVNFFMIDYKGGGTGNLLKDLPHCAGVISNLSGKQIRRAMSAITSENKRRQELLGAFQVNHIDAYASLYREKKARIAMPHLLLVVDEFAELKKEEPEFMQEIISLAQVGRSLGVHLILATQKPAGTVDDKIWSNARFRLCLRVQDRQDSMDMLHNTDAALLTAPGQCYLQIGSNEYYELFQSGYCGEAYREEGKRRAGAVLVSETGRRLRKEGSSREEKKRSQLEALVDYLRETARKNSYLPAPALWLPELPKVLLLSELREEYREMQGMADVPRRDAEGKTEVLLGLCDDPENQCRSVLTYDPSEQGHLAVCGGPASGKTSLIQTLLWQICDRYSPKEVQILIADMGQESLGCFQEMPHCLGILKKRKDRDVFFHHLERLIESRKEQLSGISCEQYNRLGKERLPLIFLVADNFGSVQKQLEEKQEELFRKVASQGITLGIYLILSAAGVSEIGGRLHEKIKTALALEMSDRFQYGDILRQYYLPVLPEENCRGRGLCKIQGRVLEFQTALTGADQGDYSWIGRIMEEGRGKTEAARREGILPEKFPVIPEKFRFQDMAEVYDWSRGFLPLGYCLSDGTLREISLKNPLCFLISGSERTGRSTLLFCLIEGIVHLGRRAVVIDLSGRLTSLKTRREITYIGSEMEADSWRQGKELGQERERGGEGKKKDDGICVFIGDMGRFCRYVYRADSEREERTAFWENEASGRGKSGFLAGICHPGKDYEAFGTAFFREFAAWQQGIHLGGNVSAQRVLDFEDLSYAQQNQREAPGIGYRKAGEGSATERLLLPEYGEEEDV